MSSRLAEVTTQHQDAEFAAQIAAMNSAPEIRKLTLVAAILPAAR